MSYFDIIIHLQIKNWILLSKAVANAWFFEIWMMENLVFNFFF